jgi:squalene cyclase
VIVEMKSGGGIGRSEIRTDDGVAEKCVGVVELVKEESGTWGGAWVRGEFFDGDGGEKRVLNEIVDDELGVDLVEVLDSGG